MKTIGEVVRLAAEYLQERHDARARRNAEDLLSFVLHVPRLEIYLQFDRPLQDDELAAYRALLKRKATGEPLEYILGEVMFYQCSLAVTPAVLIPRPETEILLDKVCEALKGEALEGKVAWDLCCGSGCLGIGLKKKFPTLSVVLSDISSEALTVAKGNGERNGCPIEIVQGDLLVPFQGRQANFVLCNPPYISQKEFSRLDSSVSQFEPKLALVGGESGLSFYERLSRELPGHLTSGAKVFLEIGTGQGEAVAALFNATCWKAKRLERDWAGHDRFFFLEFE